MVNVSHRYSPVNIDSKWGSEFQIDLKNTDLVQKYSLVIVPGTLGGGTSPAYTYNMLNPVVSHIKVEADSESYLNSDMPMIEELNKLISNQASQTGATFHIPMGLIDMEKKKIIQETTFPSYAFVNNTMTVSLPPLSQITSGSPTGTTGSTAYLVESDILRSSFSFKIWKSKKLQISSVLGLTGNNDLTNFLSIDGMYQGLLYFAYSTQDTPQYPNGSNSVITSMDLIINNVMTKSADYWVTMQAENQSQFGIDPDTGFALQPFMLNEDIDDMLNLQSPVLNKSVNLQVNTTGSGYLNALKMELF